MAGKGKPSTDSPVSDYNGSRGPSSKELNLPINHYPEVNSMVERGKSNSIDSPAPKDGY